VSYMGGAEGTIGISIGSRLACERLCLRRVSAGAHSLTQPLTHPAARRRRTPHGGGHFVAPLMHTVAEG
jgi:hypothetical protein